MDGFEALRKMYNDAGVNIHIVKFGNIGNGDMSEDQVDYYFQAAKALGAKGITRELSRDAARRLGPLADKHHQDQERGPVSLRCGGDEIGRRVADEQRQTGGDAGDLR